MARRRMLIFLAASALVALALVGWAADAVRWTVAGLRPGPARA